MPTFPRVTSRQHPLVRQCRALADGAVDGRILLDGEHLIESALDARVPVRAVLTLTVSTLARRAAAAGADVHEATAEVLAAASPVRTPSGIVAIAEWQPASLASVLAVMPALVVGLVSVQDPGNVGGVIRSSDALGATGVLALERSADPGNWKALRGAMGSTFRLPTARGDVPHAISEARRRGLRIAATVAESGSALDDCDLRAPLLVLLGSEGAGLPGAIVDTADLRITIPMRIGTNSFNIGVSAALVLWEARRQRLMPRHLHA